MPYLGKKPFKKPGSRPPYAGAPKTYGKPKAYTPAGGRPKPYVASGDRARPYTAEGSRASSYSAPRARTASSTGGYGPKKDFKPWTKSNTTAGVKPWSKPYTADSNRARPAANVHKDVKPSWVRKPAGERDLNTKWPKPSFKDDANKPSWQKPYIASGDRATPSAAKPATAKIETGWGGVAQWYHDTVEEKGSYQKDLILPNLLRLMDVQPKEAILDLACGEGFFSRRFNRLGAKVTASDISKELIEIGRRDKDAVGVEFQVAPADAIPFVIDASMDKAVIVLALQNIENVPGVFKECARVLKPAGKLYFVINHPAFRIPKQSSWGWAPAKSDDRGAGEEGTVQYRRVDRYISELREKIAMHPSALRQAQGEQAQGETTVSFHRPMQYFVKALKKNGFAVTGMEEWSSDRKSQPGPRAEAENRARIEIPMFMFIEARKL